MNNKYGKKPKPSQNHSRPHSHATPKPASAPPQQQPASTRSTTGPLWVFDAVDTWFFRESRPMESIGGAELKSVFPPPARTVMGAIRTAIGEAQGVSWHNYPREPEHQALHTLIGDGDHLGRLSFQGPWLLKEGQRLYPAPLLLLKSGDQFTHLTPASQATMCDLGKVQLPTKHNPDLQGAKPLENAWLTEAGLQAVLKGGHPEAKHIIEAKALFDDEERLGIGRNNATRTTGDGLLYQTRHVRPKEGISIGMVVQGLEASDKVSASGMVRLGAEGRLAHWTRTAAAPTRPHLPTDNRLLLVLLTHACFSQGWLPDGFEKKQLDHGQTVWEGTLHGVTLRLLCAVVGKPVREGGWDLAGHQPRAMTSLVPAGSCYFCEVLAGDAAAIAQLHGQHIGQDTAHGRGEIAVGIWNY